MNVLFAEASAREVEGSWRERAYPDSEARSEVAAAFPVGTHLVRPGMRMCWWSGRPDAGGSRPDEGVAARVIFWLCDESISPPATKAGTSAESAGWMMFVKWADRVDAHGMAARTGFYLSVELGDTVLAEIFPEWAEVCAASFPGGLDGGGASPLPLPPAARLALESIRRCPLSGPCRGLLLGARCHDLLAEFISAKDSVGPGPGHMMSDTESRVRSAAAALAQRLDVTPSLEALAREAGLSETTLKRGFRQVFGSTVFEHLRRLRMKRAKELLQSGRATVIEAATLVGYSNPSNFASAFRRQFGLNPKEFQVAARR